MGRVSLGRAPWHLLVGAIALTGVGAAFIWSSHSAGLALKHLIFGGIGCVVFVAVALFDYRLLRAVAIPLYAAGLLALAGLPAFGVTVNNARRWYDLGLVHVQPSEPMKYLLVIAFADYFRLRAPVRRLRDLAAPVLMTGLAAGLVVLEPDLGTALVMVAVGGIMLFLGGVPWRNLALLAAVGALALGLMWFGEDLGLPSKVRLKDYQKMRVLSFLFPSRNPDTPAAYNAQQAMIAINAGGLRGQGWGQGMLNRLGRIPERHTDFIFPVIAEEWGFERTLPVVLIYVTLIWTMGRLALRTREPFGRLLIAGVAATFGLQSLLHMAISLRLAPVTGLTLPLVSYGGSSLVTTYGAFGLVASVRMHRSVVFGGGGEGD